MNDDDQFEGSSKAESAGADRSRPLPGWSGFRAAVAQLLGGDDASPIGLSALYYPAVGLLLGAAMLATDRLLAGRVGITGASAVVVGVHALATRGRPLLGLGDMICRLLSPRSSPPATVVAFLAVALFVLAVALLARVDGGRAALLLFAPVLAGCAMVVLATGSRQARSDGRQIKFSRELTFREFGLASTVSFAVVFLTTEFLGLVLVLLTGGVTIAMRLLLHWRLGGVDRRSLRATGELVLLALFALMAVL